MYRRGAEVYLRIDLRILKGIGNHRRSCRVLRPVQEQCQQCIVTQTYSSARKAEEKSILQLCVLPDSYTKVLAQVIATHFNYTSYFTQQRSHPERSGFKPYKYYAKFRITAFLIAPKPVASIERPLCSIGNPTSGAWRYAEYPYSAYPKCESKNSVNTLRKHNCRLAFPSA